MTLEARKPSSMRKDKSKKLQNFNIFEITRSPLALEYTLSEFGRCFFKKKYIFYKILNTKTFHKNKFSVYFGVEKLVSFPTLSAAVGDF